MTTDYCENYPKKIMHHKEIGGQYSIIHTRANHDRLKKKYTEHNLKFLSLLNNLIYPIYIRDWPTFYSKKAVRFCNYIFQHISTWTHRMTTPTSILSPCDSCLTLSDKSQQYNSQYLMNYLSSRIPEEETEVSEITVVYDGNANINIKLCSVVCLINIYLHKKITVEDLTVNHLFVYLFYHQHNLFNKEIYIDQLKLVHLGKKYQFSTLHSIPSPRLIHDLQIERYPTLLLNIKEDNYLPFNLDVGYYLTCQQTFVDKSTGDVTCLDTLIRKWKRLQNHKNGSNTSKRRGLKNFLKSIMVWEATIYDVLIM